MWTITTIKTHSFETYILFPGCQLSENIRFNDLCSSNWLEDLDLCFNVALCCLLESFYMGGFAVAGQVLLSISITIYDWSETYMWRGESTFSVC